jgi:hypothetical protein
LLRNDDKENLLLDEERYRDRDFVLVDESHNFRNTGTQRYRVLQDFLQNGDRRCALITATPRNKSVWDIYNQLRLFHLGDVTNLPIDPPDLRQYFKLAEQGERPLPALLSNILIRRTRQHILRWYGFDADTHQRVDPDNFGPYRQGERRAYVEVAGQSQFFPKRQLKTIEYSIEATYRGLYTRLGPNKDVHGHMTDEGNAFVARAIAARMTADGFATRLRSERAQINAVPYR